ncbi:hypothetical protein HMPREF0742_00991 [Rothia aeria F0184]|uniref:Pentapeptide repeat protein n=2 Tax=Rothia aeria TaxID=172042 RepID=U7V6E2_9MICC|nr:hypothetical protein HMPREF1324_0133 [Rothia aeria F0474]ERT66338.1 hypothetical protein HMPREF0742_00991 [Rothia aeria F0184]
MQGADVQGAGMQGTDVQGAGMQGPDCSRGNSAAPDNLAAPQDRAGDIGSSVMLLLMYNSYSL